MLNLAELSASTEERPSAGMRPSAMLMVGRPDKLEKIPFIPLQLIRLPYVLSKIKNIENQEKLKIPFIF